MHGYDWICIYLDDLRECPSGCVLARNVADAVNIIRAHKGTFSISLDHDLGGDGPDAPAIIRWFMDSGRYPVETFIHSANPVGRRNLEFDIAWMRRYQKSQEDA